MVLRPAIRWCFIVLLALFTGKVYAQYVDLTKGGIIVKEDYCIHEDKVQYCVLVEYKKTLYLVVHDTKGEAVMYRVNEKDEPERIWTREDLIT